MRTLITICARGGSKGIPGKNIKTIAGKPLIGYTIDCARKLQQVLDADIVFSTDSEEIIRMAASLGLETPYRRPAELANDTCGKLDAIDHVWRWAEKRFSCRYDYVLDLDCTSPLRTLEDVLEGFRLLQEQPKALDIFSVSPAGSNPYFNMVELKSNGFYDLVMQGSPYTTRQGSPKVYDMNGSFYIYRRRFFEESLRDPNTPLSLVYIMPHLCFDLDEVTDFDYMSFLLEQGKLDFEING